MKFTDVAKAQKTAELVVSIVVLMFLLSGCVTVNSKRLYILKCLDSEKAVSQAEKEFDDAMYELSMGKKDEKTLKILSEKMHNLDEMQERSFQVCNRVN